MEEERPKRPRLKIRWWLIVPPQPESERIMETIREYANTSSIFIERPKVVPAVVASDTDLQRAFNDFMASLTAGDRAVVTTDLRQRAAGRVPNGRVQLDMSPEAIANARRLFTF